MTHLDGIFFEMTKDASGVLISAKCKVKNYKVNYRYIKSNGLSSFKKHIDKYLLKNEELQEHADNRFVQSVITRMVVEPTKDMTKKILSEFARYITHKEQLISMDNYLSFA
jgi:predicted metal-binding transcription factor (methanogenesis marker protein 9)